MNKKYLKYNLEELIEDKQFIGWVLKGSNNSNWEEFVKNNPAISTKIKQAKEIILLLRDSYEVLDEESLLTIWKNIDHFEQQHTKKIRLINIRKNLSWAASILLIISLGVLGYYNLENKSNGYEFAAIETSSRNSDAKIILPDGEEVILTSESSSISMNNDEGLININDSIIDLSENIDESCSELRMNEVVIPFGKKSELLLADGTKVWLNAGSRLAFPVCFTEKNREVYLEGEAYFEVTKNELQPFIVHAADLSITVLGTHFDISSYPEEKNIKTILIEGSVTVSRSNIFGFGESEVLLKPNQIASFSKKDNSIKVFDEPNIDFYISWTQGWMQFSQESLKSVFDKLERYYNMKIIVSQDFPSSEVISGKLDLKESLEDVMKVLGDVAKIEYRINKDEIYITKKLKRINMK